MAKNRTKSSQDKDDEMFVDVDLDEGTVTCRIITIFECGGKDYIAVLPLDKNGKNEDGEVWIYGHTEDPDGTPHLHYIEDDDEYEAASDAFDEYLDNEQFDAMP